MNTLRALTALAGGLALWASAHADTLVLLADPTRPPNSIRALMGGPSGAPAGGPAPAASGASAPAGGKPVLAAPGRQLQSIRLDQSGTGWAVIDGQVVGVGERVGDATVVSMDSDTVVLRGAQGQHKLLTLTPTVNKTAPGAVAAAARGTKER